MASNHVILSSQPCYKRCPDCTASDPLPSVEITQVTADSRQVQPGALFVAVQGGAADGHRFIADAIRRGAAAVVGTAH